MTTIWLHVLALLLENAVLEDPALVVAMTLRIVEIFRHVMIREAEVSCTGPPSWSREPAHAPRLVYFIWSYRCSPLRILRLDYSTLLL